MLRLDALDVFVIASQASWYGPRSSDERSLDAAAAGGYVLTGSVRGSGEQARITVRLIEAETGAQLWTAAYDEPFALDEVRALEERVARDVVAIAAPYGPIFDAELAHARRSIADAEAARLFRHVPRVSAANRGAGVHGSARVLSKRERAAARRRAGVVRARDAVRRRVRLVLRAHRRRCARGRASRYGESARDRPRRFSRESRADARAVLRRRSARSAQSIDRTLALRPNSAQALAQGGFLLVVSGDSARGLLLGQKARALIEDAARLCST